jgi:cardiolipin synthase
LYYAITHQDQILAGAIILYALVSDGLDGWLARRWNVESEVGILLDPLSDKCTLIALYGGVMHFETVASIWWLCCALILKELTRIVSGAWLYAYGVAIYKLQSAMPGKVMFVVNMLMGCVLLCGLRPTAMLFCVVLASYSVLLLYIIRWCRG